MTGRLPLVHSGRRVATAIVSTALACGLALAYPGVTTAPALANDADFTGKLWHDGLDTRYQAIRMGQAASSAGYAARTATTGQTASTVFDRGREVSVLGLFGHGAPGLILTDDDGPDRQQVLYAGCPLCEPTRPETSALLNEYLPLLDIDDVRLAIFAACETSRVNEFDGHSLPGVATARGVDAVVSFAGIVYSPVSTPGTPVNQTVHSGNYYWDRAAHYLANGTGVEASLKRALSDLVAKEGKQWGYQTWRVHGSVANPGAVTLRPARVGEPHTSDITWDTTGTAAFANLSDLDVTSQSVAPGLDGPIILHRTREGVEYRLGPDGELYDLTAPTATRGPVRYSLAEAEQQARQFLQRNLPDAGVAHKEARVTPISRVSDDSMARMEWTSISGDRFVAVEVDRRTGAVTYALNASGGTDASERASVSREDAVSAAIAAVGGDREVVDAELRAWGQLRWQVRLEAEPIDLGREVIDRWTIVDVDADTGEVIALSAN